MGLCTSSLSSFVLPRVLDLVSGMFEVITVGTSSTYYWYRTGFLVMVRAMDRDGAQKIMQFAGALISPVTRTTATRASEFDTSSEAIAHYSQLSQKESSIIKTCTAYPTVRWYRTVRWDLLEI